MREILFRGKRKDNRKWVYGTGITDFLNQYPDIKGFFLWSEYMWQKVFPATIGQYTGLKDKNGTKIFEGDIVQWLSHFGKVIFEDGSFKICWKSGVNYDTARLVSNYEQHSLIVIDNIHDNGFENLL